ncbi:MAG: hypothetical protein BZ138_08270, partial [Methanosphaera sp. rholeuAM270]
MNRVLLSKTSYCKYLQCPKMLWLKKYKSYEAIQKANPRIFENGKKVGILAQNIFGKRHEDIHYQKNFKKMIQLTSQYLEKKPNIITEATFSYENNFCMVDILKNDEDGVEIYEVKSSTKVTDVYIDDASFQYYILSNLGLNVKKVCIIYINSKYIRQEKLNLDELFNIEDITHLALQKQDEITGNVEMINDYMALHDRDNEPIMDIGKQCRKPYPCDFWEYCTRDMPQTDACDDEPNIDKKAIRDIIDSLKYPLYFIDYETYSTPIPEVIGTTPYQQLPFQYSLHIINEEGAKPEHKEYLADIDDEDFIRHFAESMIADLPENGSVIVYNKSLERGHVNEKLAGMYPDLAGEIERINANMVDFMEPFRKKQYYTKEMR